jgi:hypothetical protein
MYRIALILAVVAAIGSLVVSFLFTGPKVTQLKTDLESTTASLTAEQQARTEADKKAKDATAAAEKAVKELAETKKSLEEITVDATTQRARADKYFADFTKAETAKNDAQEKLARWDALNVQPEQITGLQKDLKETKELKDVLELEKKEFLRNIAFLKSKLSRYEGDDTVVEMPGLKGRVLAVDAKWEFVLLDVGSDNGAKEGGIVMVRRGDKLVGKARIVDVQPRKSVANIMADWKQGDVSVQENDLVLY